MRNFKWFLIPALAIALVWPTYELMAKWNTVQRPDGTTDWSRTGVDNVEEVVPLGRVILTVVMEDISTASTNYVVVPVTGVRISRVDFVTQKDIGTRNVEFDMWHLDTAGVEGSEITNGVTRAQFSASAITGASASFTPTVAPEVNNFTQGHVIAIHVNGNGDGAGSGDAVVVITLEPR